MKRFIIFLFLSSCRTTQQIRQEQYYDNLSNQVSKGQELSAVSMVRMERMETQFNKFNGTLQELEHQLLNSVKSNEESIAEFSKKLDALTKDLESVKKNMLELQKATVASRKTASVGNNLPFTYEAAVKSYRAAKYNDAETQFKHLLDNKKVTGDQLAHTYHNLGMISYMNKNYEYAQTYFSKLYTSFPSTGYVPNGLLYLAKSFQENKQKKEAIATLNQLIKSHPESKSAEEAKRTLAGLQN